MISNETVADTAAAQDAVAGNGGAPERRRALILAGGGQKVAFQAGVLQVWLDEAKISFEFGDGASGGVLNLVQWCTGHSGTTIADHWRSMHPLKSVDVNWRQLIRGPYARSLFKLGKFRNTLSNTWALDWPTINSQVDRKGTFNVYNFSRHKLEQISHADIDEDLVIAGISLPFWFPPIPMPNVKDPTKDDLYIDAVYALDANPEAMIEAGADELWIVWTVSERGRWRDGAIAEYFQAIEAASNSKFRDALRRINVSNERHKGGAPSTYGRHIEYKLLKHEVPLHYLFAFSGDRIAEAVNLGVEAAREWCRDEGISYEETPVSSHPEQGVEISFRERAHGLFNFGSSSAVTASRSRSSGGETVSVELLMKIDDVEKFVRSPFHEGKCSGSVVAQSLGGHLEVREGSHFNLLVEDKAYPDRIDRKLMLYRLFLEAPNGGQFTLVARKTCDIERDRRDRRAIKNFWFQTTTFDAKIQDGWHEAGDDGDLIAGGEGGEMYLTLLDFLHQMTTYRSPNGWRKGLAGVARFDRMFVSHLWDAYFPNVLSSCPF